MQLKRLSFLLLFICGYLTCVQSQTTVLNPQTDKKLLKQFQDAKLGLFIHWMACHSPGTGDSWAIGNGTPKSVADSITMKWNPQNFNPKEIVNVAVQAGCKYMVVISKHHDGFCIWPSEYSIFDIDRIPFKRDILKELGEECRKQGLLYGIYYSIADIDYCGWNSMAQVGREIMFERFFPDEYVVSTYVIPFERLYEEGYRGVIFDIDNTLVPHGAPADDRAKKLFRRLKEIGFSSCLISNNQEERVKMFNQEIRTNYIYNAHKPSTKNYEKAMKIMGTDKTNTFFVGDQLFTDVWGAKRTGIHNILVRPIDPKEEIQIVLKRYLEKIVLHFYKKRLKNERN